MPKDGGRPPAPDDAAPDPVPEPAPDPNAGMILMHKADEMLYVHPDTVKAHAAAGWKLV